MCPCHMLHQNPSKTPAEAYLLYHPLIALICLAGVEFLPVLPNRSWIHIAIVHMILGNPIDDAEGHAV